MGKEMRTVVDGWQGQHAKAPKNTMLLQEQSVGTSTPRVHCSAVHARDTGASKCVQSTATAIVAAAQPQQHTNIQPEELSC